MNEKLAKCFIIILNFLNEFLKKIWSLVKIDGLSRIFIFVHVNHKRLFIKQKIIFCLESLSFFKQIFLSVSYPDWSYKAFVTLATNDDKFLPCLFFLYQAETSFPIFIDAAEAPSILIRFLWNFFSSIPKHFATF